MPFESVGTKRDSFTFSPVMEESCDLLILALSISPANATLELTSSLQDVCKLRRQRELRGCTGEQKGPLFLRQVTLVHLPARYSTRGTRASCGFAESRRRHWRMSLRTVQLEVSAASVR